MDQTTNHNLDLPPKGWFARIALGERLRGVISDIASITSALSDDGATAAWFDGQGNSFT